VSALALGLALLLAGCAPLAALVQAVAQPHGGAVCVWVTQRITNINALRRWSPHSWPPRLGRRPPQEPTAQQGTTFVIVSHALAEIRTLCDRVVWLASGKIMMQGEPDEVIATYEKS
jgi:hypothetical protein